MAGSTLLQSLDSTYEDGTSRGVTPSNRRQIEYFIPSAPISIGDAVSFDTSQTADGDKTLFVLPADTGTLTSRIFVGIALDAAVVADVAAGNAIRVCISGICVANISAANCANEGINLMINTGGDLQDYAPASVLQNACMSCEARDGVTGKATVVVFKSF